jgi:hypothetical protein
MTADCHHGESGMAKLVCSTASWVDVATLQQIIQAAYAEPAISVSLDQLVAVTNAMAAETRQQPNNPETKPWP